MPETRTREEVWQHIGEVKSEAAQLLEKMRTKPSEMTAEDHAKADELFAEATQAQADLNEFRTTSQLENIAEMRAEYADVGAWAQRSGNHGGLIPVQSRERKLEDEPLLWIHETARQLHNGERANASLNVNLGPAHVQRQLINLGVEPSEMAMMAQNGTLGAMLTAELPTAYGRDEKGRKAIPVQAALSTDELTPSTWSTTFYDYMESLPGLRAAGAMVTPMTRGNTIDFYANTSHYKTTLTATTEGTAAGETEDTYKPYTVNTAMYTGMALLSRQLIEDAAPAGILGIVGRDLSRVVTRKMETAYHAVAFPVNPADATTVYQVSATGATATTAGEPMFPTKDAAMSALVGMLFALDEAYIQGNARWLIPKKIAQLIRLIKIDNVGYPYQLTGNERFPMNPEGHPAMFDAFFPAIIAQSSTAKKTGTPVLAIGSWMDAFHIVDVGTIRLDMSREYKFAEQQVTLLASLRTGGAIRDTRAAATWNANTGKK